jgi:hypothetical protein
MRATVSAATTRVVTVNAALRVPEGTTIVGGTDATASLLDKRI